jgi:hypothetical protein
VIKYQRTGKEYRGKKGEKSRRKTVERRKNEETLINSRRDEK